MTRRSTVDTIFINGTVGVGKSTLADAVGAREPGPHAVIDLDELRRFHPAPSADRFNHELELINLRSFAANYRRAGAQRFVLAGVIENPAEIDRYLNALGSTGMFICRLHARPEELESRLRHRHAGDAATLQWHLARVGELNTILRGADIDDLVLDSSDTSPGDLARDVRRAAGWDSSTPG